MVEMDCMLRKEIDALRADPRFLELRNMIRGIVKDSVGDDLDHKIPCSVITMALYESSTLEELLTHHQAFIRIVGELVYCRRKGEHMFDESLVPLATFMDDFLE